MGMTCAGLGGQTEKTPHNTDEEEYVLPYGSKGAQTITVSVIGPAVRKPGFYHIKADTTFAELMKSAGLLKTSNGRVGVRRVVNGHTTTTNISVKQNDFKLFDADVFYATELPPVEVLKPNLTNIEETLALLQQKQNLAFTKLLVGHLENYPFDWSQEGSEHLIPDLKTLLEDKSGTKARN
jgi:hypothetical protein